MPPKNNTTPPRLELHQPGQRTKSYGYSRSSCCTSLCIGSKLAFFGGPSILSDAASKDPISVPWETLFAVLQSLSTASLAGQLATVGQEYNFFELKNSEQLIALLGSIAGIFGLSLTLLEIQIIAKGCFERLKHRHTTYDTFCFYFREFANQLQRTVGGLSAASYTYVALSDDPEALSTFLQVSMLTVLAVEFVRNGYFILDNGIRAHDGRLKKILNKVFVKMNFMEALETTLTGAGVGSYAAYSALSGGFISDQTFVDTSGYALIAGASIGGLIGLYKTVVGCAQNKRSPLYTTLLHSSIYAKAFLDALLRAGTATLAGFFTYHVITGNEEVHPAAVVLSLVFAGAISIEAFIRWIKQEVIKGVITLPIELELSLLANQERRQPRRIAEAEESIADDSPTPNSEPTPERSEGEAHDGGLESDVATHSPDDDKEDLNPSSRTPSSHGSRGCPCVML